MENELQIKQPKLHETLSMLMNIFNHTSSMIAFLDRDFNFISVNNAYASAVNRSVDDFAGKNHFEMYPDSENQQIFCKVRDTGEAVYYHEKPFVYPDDPHKKITYWNWSLVPTIEDNKVTGLVLTLTDVTDTVDARRDLQMKAMLLDNVSDATVGMDRNFCVIYWNKAAEELFEWNREEVLGKYLLDIIKTDFTDKKVEELKDELSKNGYLSFEVVQYTKSGRKLYIENVTHAICDSGGQITGYVSVRKDISERKRQLELLKINEARFRNAVENLPFFVIIYDADRKIQFANAYTRSFVEMEHDELTGNTNEGVFGSETSAKFDLILEECLDSGTSVSGEIRLIYRGSKHIFCVNYVPVLQDSKVYQIMGIYHEITDKKEAEEKQLKILRELSRSNKELEEFAYIASHDLQEPVRMAVSFSELLSRKYSGRMDQEADEFISYIVAAGKRMSSLIRDLLIYSRINTNIRPFEYVNTADVLSEVLEDLKILLDESRAKLNCHSMPVVFGDRIQIRQLFQNLIVNAVKFRGQNSPVIEIGCRQNGIMHEFFVRDNGIGIEEEFFEKIFLIFQRLHAHDKYPGTGIGLSLCKKIVETHGGKIWVESAPGKGSAFYFTLSASDA